MDIQDIGFISIPIRLSSLIGLSANFKKLKAPCFDEVSKGVPMPSPSDRQRSPIFAMGCHRSGTNLLYDMLLSSGGFAIYRGLIPIYNMLLPRFGGFEMERWALYVPGNVLHIERIKRDIPNALFLHISVTDATLRSRSRKWGVHSAALGTWSNRPPRGNRTLLEWMVRKGRTSGRKFPADYMEVRYEDLLTEPQKTLDKLGAFIDHDLDYERIQRAGLGCLSETNSSFRGDAKRNKCNPWLVGKEL